MFFEKVDTNINPVLLAKFNKLKLEAGVINSRPFLQYSFIPKVILDLSDIEQPYKLIETAIPSNNSYQVVNLGQSPEHYKQESIKKLIKQERERRKEERKIRKAMGKHRHRELELERINTEIFKDSIKEKLDNIIINQQYVRHHVYSYYRGYCFELFKHGKHIATIRDYWTTEYLNNISVKFFIQNVFNWIELDYFINNVVIPFCNSFKDPEKPKVIFNIEFMPEAKNNYILHTRKNGHVYKVERVK